MKILIVEDQEKLAQLVKRGLEKEGYTADYVTDGDAGQRRIELHHKDYDLIVLDLMLPGKNGLEICQNVRQFNIPNPILILTAKDGVENKVELFDAGADDYLVKPFDFKELLARIRALTRRPKAVLPGELKIGDLSLNPITKKVLRAGQEVNLTLTEFKILEYLMRHPDQVVKREDLIDNVWDFDFDSFSNVLDVFINKIRKKVEGEDPQKLIETVRGVGYRLKA